MQGFTTIDLIILIVYLAAVLFAGLRFAKKQMKGKEYFKGDGTVPWWVTSVSIFATLLSPISFLSLAGNSYAGTWIMWFAQLGMLLAIPFTIRFFLPIYSKLGIDTAYHYLELRFESKGLRVLGAVMFIIYQIGRMSIIMYLPCMVLANLTGINVNLLIIIMGVIAIIYSYTGGLKSVLWTDFIQGSVLLVGVTIALLFLIAHTDGGFGALFDAFRNDGKFLAPDQPVFSPNLLKDSVFLLIVGAGFNTMGSYVSSQDIVQRFQRALNKCYDYRASHLDETIQAAADFAVGKDIGVSYDDLNSERDQLVFFNLEEEKEWVSSGHMEELFQLQLNYMQGQDQIGTDVSVTDYVRLDLIQKALETQ